MLKFPQLTIGMVTFLISMQLAILVVVLSRKRSVFPIMQMRALIMSLRIATALARQLTVGVEKLEIANDKTLD